MHTENRVSEYMIANDKNTIEAMRNDSELREIVKSLFTKIAQYKYSYNFSWLGRPQIQLPADIVAMQEIVWNVQPDLIIETGIAHGGSLIFYASMLELLGQGEVLGIDIDIRAHNRAAIESHPMYKRIRMVEGSSIERSVVDQVYAFSENKNNILLVLDSNHTHDHVYQELKLYSPLVKKDSYIIIMDTIIEDMPKGSFSDRPWDKGNNPKTAVHEFLKETDRFSIDSSFTDKLLITACPDGFLRCVND